MKKIGLDVGDVRIGIAVSDMLGICANSRERRVVPSVADALSAALEYARSLENAGTPSEARPLIYVGGSTYVVAEAMAALRG